MKKIPLLLSLILLSAQSFAQADTLLQSLQSDTSREALLPQKMLFTQRAFWGERGLYRKLGWAPLTPQGREKELRLRRTMLTLHQVLGFITAAEMAAQGVVGYKLYKGNEKMLETHEALAGGIITTYTLTALMSLTAPPPLINRDKGVTSIRLHKWLAIAHLTGMVVTNVLAGKIEDNPDLKPYHRAAALGTFGTFTAAIVVIKF
ncbi:hypothetical protein V9K67_15255 [Paraflavisolibacter sp. H34]|uniref:hypothetical protein n=1 Tax=Huijunlia imazamoxiresistens TaxID=3127457 RepID=UPI0030170EB2